MSRPGAPLTIRPFATADGPMLEEWLEECGLTVPEAGWEERITSDPRILCLVGCLSGDRPCAFVRLDIGPDRTAEITLITAANARRHGVGTRLLAAALGCSRDLGVRRLLAVVDENNRAAQAFFASQGFEGTGVWIPGYVQMARVVHGAGSQPPLEIVL